MAIIMEANNDFTSHVYTEKERKYIHILRTMLKDYPDDNMLTLNHLVEQDRGERWSDAQLLVYIQQGIADVNNEPPLTDYTVETLPNSWQSVCVQGAVIFALLAESIKQSGELIFNLIQQAKYLLWQVNKIFKKGVYYYNWYL